MGVYWFVANNRDQAGRLVPPPPGYIWRFVLNYPGTIQDAVNFAVQNRLGSPGVRYTPIPVAPNDQTAAILAVEFSVGAQGLNPSQPVLSGQHVQGGQVTGFPQGQHQDRPHGPVEQSGFQKLGDEALEPVVPGDFMTGGMDDATYSDIVHDGGAVREVRRQ